LTIFLVQKIVDIQLKLIKEAMDVSFVNQFIYCRTVVLLGNGGLII